MTSPAHRVFAVGRYQSSCAVAALPKQNVQRMLPGELSLTEQTLTPPGEHPVLLMFGSHSGVKPVFMPGSGSSYREFILAIPYIQRVGSDLKTGPLAHMSRLYLDKWGPTIAGWIYGYPKQRARIRSTATSYEIASYLGDRPLIRETTSAGPEAPRSTPPDFSPIAPAMFEQPFVQIFFGGLVVCSVMTFHLSTATVQPLEMTVRIEKSFLPGLLPGEKQFQGIDQTPLGGFLIDVSWSLSYPMGLASLMT